jgi:hypothetical protein
MSCITMSENENDNEVLTTPKRVELRRSGTSDVLTVPAEWRKTIPVLQGPLLFDARVERVSTGQILIVFEKVKRRG